MGILFTKNVWDIMGIIYGIYLTTNSMNLGVHENGVIVYQQNDN